MDPSLTLEGVHVRLEPLSMRHVPDLARVAADPELWRFVPLAIASPIALTDAEWPAARVFLEAALRRA